MADSFTLSALSLALRPLVSAVSAALSRLRAERAAVEVRARPDLMDSNLNQTLDRLRRGNIDDSWWQSILNWAGQEYIAPEFLKAPALQEWLAQEHVADDLKALARATIMGGDGEDSQVRERLAQSYSNRTDEARQLAGGYIDAAVGILVAGYIASIPSDQAPIAGMIQDLSGQFQDLSGRLDDRFDRSEGARLAALIDPITRKAHTEQAKKELAKILSLRAFDSVRWRRKIQELLTRVSNGDLIAVDELTKNEVRYWTARLCAADTEVLDQARQIREGLGQTDPERDLSIVDALLAESDGEIDEALRVLRDRDDPDSRTALFGLLTRTRGTREALDWHAGLAAPDDGTKLTAVGWSNWAIGMAEVGEWQEAASRLRSLEHMWRDVPVLALVEGVINAALLLPSERREIALKGVPLFPGIRRSVGEDAKSHHSRAVTCFEVVGERLGDVADDDLTHSITEWGLWLRLMDPKAEKADAAREDLRQHMDKGARAVTLAPFAYVFDISYDDRALRVYLEHRRRLGGLDDQELLAECLLAQQSMEPRDLVEYLEQHKARLAKVVPIPFMTTMRADALIRDGQTHRARTVVAENAADLGEAYTKYLIAEIEAKEGLDPRKALEDLYEQTRSPDSLVRLVNHLKAVDDRAALLPLVKELFAHQRTVENAHDIVGCLSPPSSIDHNSIIQFLEENFDLLEQSDQLKAAKAWALYHAGRFRESRALIEILLNRRTEEEDLQLDINIAVASGDWERLAAIVDREWSRRDSHCAETLMSLAHHAGHQTQDPTRALQLARLAAEKEPGDPRILAAVYWMHFRLGRDDQANRDWLARATELSSGDEGPVWPVTLREVVTEWLPRRQEYVRAVEGKLLRGEIPISVAAAGFNLSLARLFLTLPDQNASQWDGRRRVTVPIVAGVREPVDLREDWTIGMDVTSVLTLTHLGLLESAIGALHHTKFAPEVMEWLFLERDEVRFHQPSRIATAKRVRDLQTGKQLQLVNNSTAPPDDIVAEVGLELATLLYAARENNGGVICVLPISKVGSLGEESADTSRYQDLIHSTMQLCTLLHERGKIAAADYHVARSFLESQGQAEGTEPSPKVLDGPIYMDRLALAYLQDAGVLEVIAAVLDVRVHQIVFDEMNALIEQADTGHELANQIDEIRRILRQAVESGKASFLPRSATHIEWPQKREFRLQATESLLDGSAACDALCFDDRYINRTRALSVSSEQSIPAVCILDVLRHLASRGCIDVADHWTARHRLRQAGFAFIPLEADEVLYWLNTAGFNNGQLTESVELRTLRQSVARADSFDLADPAEVSALTANVTATCRQVVVDLWEDGSLMTERVAKLSDWVWYSLAAVASPIGRRLLGERYRDWAGGTLSSRLGSLFLPLTIKSQDRRAEYSRWLDQFVLQRLRPANSGTIETALSSVRKAIATLEEASDLCGYLFLEQLPETVRRKAINDEPEFASRCGFSTRRVLEIGSTARLADSEVFAAAKEVFATREKQSLRDVGGNYVSVALDEERNIVMEWADADGVPQHIQIPDLALISPNGRSRRRALHDAIRRLGPTATDFRHLLEEVESRELTHQELTAIFDESSNGVEARQFRLAGKIQRGLGFSIDDIVPPPISYFEGFAGPSPGNHEPEDYLGDVLVPYRMSLLRRDLSRGLDICCLGALRDDLLPGLWVDSIDDDAVWAALSSCDVKRAPISLLAVLDVALYRQDPRFREFAADAVARLLDEHFGMVDGPDVYGLLTVLAEFILNRISLLERGANYPGYWKRMSAWMQAGLVARTLITTSSSIDIDDLQKWTRGNMAAAGGYAELVDARTEPMIFASRITSEAFQGEILSRLHALRLRHEGEGHQVPRSDEIEDALAASTNRERRLILGFPGPLEGHKRPDEPFPQEVSDRLRSAWAASSERDILQQLVTVSQMAALDDSMLERARDAVKTTVKKLDDTSREEHLNCLEFASIVAAATRDAVLADSIADAVIGMIPTIANVDEIGLVLQVTLRAAVAYEAHDTWFNWLEERLTRIANSLPPPPNESQKLFLVHLGELSSILPVESWFHTRARSVAMSGF